MSREYPSSPLIGVGAVIIKDQQVLVVRRANQPNRGLWSIPGGLLELGETLAQAAAREVWEESHVKVEILRPLSVDELLHRDEQGRLQYHYVLIDMLARWVSGSPTPGSDALAAEWAKESELPQLHLVRRLEPILYGALKSSSNLNLTTAAVPPGGQDGC